MQILSLIILILAIIVSVLLTNAIARLSFRKAYRRLEEDLTDSRQQELILLEKYNQLESREIAVSGQLRQTEEQNRVLSVQLARSETEKEMTGQSLTLLSDNFQKLENSSKAQTLSLQKLQQELHEKKILYTTLQEKLEEQKIQFTELQQTAHFQFEQLAQKILEEKTEHFTLSNKQNIERLLQPLKEDIGKFKEKVEETYDKESKQRFSLEQKVKELIEQTNKVSSEANNLANALKGQNKKQGDWGEMILERILETSGLTRGREYIVQPSFRNEEGKTLRPDVLVQLPGKRYIIIDSKVSLVDYDRYMASDLTAEQQQYLARHLKSVYQHINDLSSKAYDTIDHTLDFVMLFIPIEPAYLLAIQQDPQLWSYAYSKRILLISPTNLIACLKLVSDLWKREKQSKNAMDIVKRGELLYDKLVSFTQNMEEIGKHISKARNAYDAAVQQLKSGKGNIIQQTIQLKELGLKSSKNIAPGLIDNDEEMPA